jgi:hypothetical protein
MEGGAVGHNMEMGLLKDYPCQVWLRNSLTYILGFSVKFFFQPIYTDYAN